MPGLIGAFVAYVVARLLAYAGMGSVVVEFLVFLAIYLVVTIATERAMVAHARDRVG
jgi:hypothetical protein